MAYPLVLQGQCVQFYGSGGNSQNEFETETPVFDKDFVSRVADFFKIAPNDRHHPGQKFLASFIVKHEGYGLNGPVNVTFRLTNTGDKPFDYESFGFLGSKFNGCPSPSFTFSAHDERTNEPVQNLPNHFNEQAIDMLIPGGTLKPKESRSVDLDLKDYLKLDRKGTYFITGSCAFTVLDRPNDQEWDEHGTDRFSVDIH